MASLRILTVVRLIEQDRNAIRKHAKYMLHLTLILFTCTEVTVYII